MFEHLPAAMRILLVSGADIALAAALATSQAFSGFFITADGYAVTNNHVVNGNAAAEIRLDDGKTYKARVVATGGPMRNGNQCFKYSPGNGHDGRFGSWGACPQASSTSIAAAAATPRSTRRSRAASR